MTVRDFLVRNARLEIGEESAFQTAPAGAFPNVFDPLVISPSSLVVDGLTQTMLENADESVRQRDAKDRIAGLKSDGAKCGFAFDAKAVPAASFLTSTVTGGARELSHRLIYRHMFGTERVDAGSTVAVGGGTSTTVLTVGAGHGARFATGTWIAVANNAGDARQWTRVEAVDVDELTVHPPLAAIPADGTVVWNGYNYAPSGSGATAPNQKSLAIRRVFAAFSELQWQLLGCFGDINFKFPSKFGQLLSVACDFMVTNWANPSAAGYSAAVVADDMGAKAVFHQATLLVAARAALDRTSTRRYEGFDVQLPSKWDPIPDGNATQARNGCMQTAGRPAAVTGKLVVPHDNDEYTAFTSRTERSIVLAIQIGSGITASFLIFDVPRFVLSAAPKPVSLGEGRGGLELAFEGLPDDGITGGTSDHDLAAFRFALL
jgi:hypothetical protein